MNTGKFLAGAALATIVGLSMNVSAVAGSNHNNHKGAGMVKCYGVAMKGKNDCGTATHSCAGQAKADKNPKDWVFMKKAACIKIHGKPVADSKHMSRRHHGHHKYAHRHNHRHIAQAQAQKNG